MSNIYRLLNNKELVHPITSHITPLVAFKGKIGFPAGTCVLLAPYLAVTARHVIEEVNDYFNFSPWPKNTVPLDIYLCQLNGVRVWHVSQVFAWQGTDIAFLKLYPRNEQAKTLDTAFLKITVDPPELESEITALGYPKSEVVVERNDAEVTNLKMTLNPTVSTGRVKEIYRSFRDRNMINFPAFSVDARFPPGMSGGAVFNEKKELCGLVCSGLQEEQNNGQYYSTVVSIWTSMINKITFNSGDYIPKGLELNKEYTVLELAKNGHLNVQGYERIKFFKQENGSDGISRKHF